MTNSQRIQALRCPGPACGGDMIAVSREGVTFDRCNRCEALWFDARELELLMELEHARIQVPEWDIPKRGIGTRACPRCVKPMETAGWTGVVLDRCRSCRGLFVEAREYTQMRDWNQYPVPQSFEAWLSEKCIASSYAVLSLHAIAMFLARIYRRQH